MKKSDAHKLSQKEVERLPKIYRDFDHWWREGNHGWTSASRDIAEEQWAMFESTIMATRDDYKNSYVALMQEEVKTRCMLTDALLAYIDLYAKEDAPKFWRWWCDQALEDSKKGTSEP